MKTLDVEIALMQHFDITRNIIVPNVTSMGSLCHFETDLLILSKANYATGIEIKISKSDLKNDLKKKQWKNPNDILYQNKRRFEFYFKPYKFFYYAVPEVLKADAIEQIPSWCGLITLKNQNEYFYPRVDILREPKQLFNNKWDDKKRMELSRLGAMRILNLKHKINQLSK